MVSANSVVPAQTGPLRGFWDSLHCAIEPMLECYGLTSESTDFSVTLGQSQYASWVLNQYYRYINVLLKDTTH